MPASSQLLAHIIDYAGLFPPASLELNEVVRNYDQYFRSDDRWLLARIIIPALRLAEYREVATDEVDLSTTQDNPWLVSALLPPPSDEKFLAALSAIKEFNLKESDSEFKSCVDTVEVLVREASMLTSVSEQVPASVAIFAELPHTENEEHFQTLAEIRSARSNIYAKIRTGGVTPDLIPSSEVVAGFILNAAKFNVGFKATAGLHHPIRDEFALTYENDSPRSVMHGFLNVFLAAAFTSQGKLSRDQLIRLLDEQDTEAFEFGDQSVTWHEHELGAAELEKTRATFAISFGSCSFTEPLEDLRHLKLVELPTV